jgi:hypothetical protein
MELDLWHIDHNATGSTSYAPWKWISSWAQECHNCTRGTQRSTECNFGALSWPYEKKSIDEFAIFWRCIPKARKISILVCLIRFTKHQNWSYHFDTSTVHWHKSPHRSLSTIDPSVEDALGILAQSFHAYRDRHWSMHFLPYWIKKVIIKILLWK